MIINTLAPSFNLLNQNGENTSLEDLCSKGWLILYFYPKDNTSGCSLQAQDFKKYHSKFAEKNCQNIGISKD